MKNLFLSNEEKKNTTTNCNKYSINYTEIYVNVGELILITLTVRLCVRWSLNVGNDFKSLNKCYKSFKKYVINGKKIYNIIEKEWNQHTIL